MVFSQSLLSAATDHPRTTKVLNQAREALYTLYLFTKADYHTLFFPIMMFALVAGPFHTPLSLLSTAAWTLLHQLQCNLNNQLVSISEDASNKPWRPLPSKRVTPSQARLLWVLVTVLCWGWCAAAGGRETFLASVAVTGTTIMYDQGRGAAHWAERIPLVCMMYGIFEYGATRVMTEYAPLDSTAKAAILSSMLVLSSTAHVGDFPDVVGDAEDGRVTIPIAFPNSSRVITPLLLVGWSVEMARSWELGWACAALLVGMGAWIGWRVWSIRDRKEEKKTYMFHSLWLLTIHLLPMNARWGVLSF